MGFRALTRSIGVSSMVLATLVAPSWADGVRVSLISTSSIVTPGSEFEIVLLVPQTGDGFNAYDATITWDPAALTYLPTSPLTLQEGEYMTGACGVTFHWFKQYPDNVRISHSLWCQGVLLNGPGQLYVLRFRATGSPQVTQVTLAANEFYAAGYTVASVVTSNASVMIDGTTDAPPPSSAFHLVASPNPFNPTTVLHVESPEAGLQTVRVHDVTGRLVRTLDRGTYPAGPRTITWNGSDDRGARLPSGSYLITFETPERATTKRVILIK